MMSKKLKSLAFKKLNWTQRLLLWVPVLSYALYVGYGSYISKYGVDDFSFYDHRGMVSCVLFGGNEPTWTCKNSSGMNLAETLPVKKRIWSYDGGNITVTRTVALQGAKYTLKSSQLNGPMSAVVQ